VKAPRRLQPGQDVDRFGGVHGTFLSPQGIPFPRRALPPQNLDGVPPQACNYHQYVVTKAFRVEAGPAAAWFAQPGHGIQYVLDPTLIPGAPRTLDVNWLLHHGYLVPTSPFASAQSGALTGPDPSPLPSAAPSPRPARNAAPTRGVTSGHDHEAWGEEFRPACWRCCDGISRRTAERAGPAGRSPCARYPLR
jgi:nicrotizing toxin Mtb-like protein